MSIGFAEILLVVIVILILFGAGKLPHVMGDLAKGVKNFKRGMADTEDDAPPAKKETSTADAPSSNEKP